MAECPAEPPKQCKYCDNPDIDVNEDPTGVFEWTWTCIECMNGDVKFEAQHKLNR